MIALTTTAFPQSIPLFSKLSPSEVCRSISPEFIAGLFTSRLNCWKGSTDRKRTVTRNRH